MREAGAAGPGPRSRRGRGAWLVLGASLLLLSALLVLERVRDHRAVDSLERERLASLAVVVEKNLSRRLQATSNALDVIRTDLPWLLAQPDGRTLVNRRLAQTVASQVGVRSFHVVDEGGTVLASNRGELIGLSFRDQERYRTIRAGGDADVLYASAPFRTPVGTWAIALGRMIPGREGRFAGYVLAISDADYFDLLLRTILYAPDMQAAIVHGDGKVAYRVPDQGPLAGEDLAKDPTSFFSLHLASGRPGSVLSGPSPAGGRVRLAAARTIRPETTPSDRPLVVLVSREVAAVFAPWRRETVVRGALVGVLALVSPLGLAVYRRRVRADERLLAARQAERDAAQRALEEHRQGLEALVDERTAELYAREGELRAASSRALAILRSVPLPACVVEGERITFRNQSWLDTLGWTEDEAGTLTACWVLAYPDAGTVGAVETSWRAESEAARREARGMRPYETVFRCKDGRERRFEISGMPIESAFVLSFVDVTEREERTRQLAELSEFNARLFAASPEGKLVFRADGPCIAANDAAARLLGQSVEQLLTLDLARSPVLVNSGLSDAARDAIRTGRSQRLEREVETPGGRTVTLAHDVTPFDRAGAPHLLVSIGDITPFREAERTLRDASRAKSEFLASTSHEIRTPMNVVLGIAQLLDGPDLPGEKRDLVRALLGSGRSLLAIVNDVLDVSKVEAGALKLETAPFDLGTVLANLATVLAESVGSKPVELVIEEPVGLRGRLVGDALRLEQVLVNLAGNAVKFTAEGAVVVSVRALSAAGDAVRLRFSVRDTGIGISAEKLASVFDPFAQADASTARRFGGTGLGLAISRRLVELMGGELRAASAVGQGSEFSFELPFRLEAAEVEPPGRRLRLLLVDGSPLTLAALAAAATGLGWDVEAVSSEEEALARTTARAEGGEPWDAVLAAWRIPGGPDGLDLVWTVTEAARASGADGQPLAVLLATSAEREDLRRAGAAAEADLVLTKPVTSKALGDALLGSLERRAIGSGEPAPGHLPRLTGIRLLVVDDSGPNRLVARGLLEREGALVEEAGDGHEAIARLEAEPYGFDAVLMDVQMPSLDGLSATRAIRDGLSLAGLPILALSAGVGREDRDEAVAAGMNGFVAKPIDVDELVAAFLSAGVGSPAPEAARPLAAPALEVPGRHPFPHLPGIDARRAEERLAGNRDLLLALLGNLAEEFGAAAAATRSDLAGGNGALAAARMHKLRGVAGALAAGRVASAAAALETALKTGAPVREEVLLELEAAIDEVVRAGAPLLAAPAAPAAGTEAPPLDGARLEALARALERQDLAALALLDGLKEGLAAHLGTGEAEGLGRDVAALRFGAALARVKGLLSARDELLPGSGGGRPTAPARG